MHEDDGFDLVEMQTFVQANAVTTQNKPEKSMQDAGIDEIVSISSQNEPGPSTSRANSAFRSNSNSHLYWYQVAVKDGRRKSSMAVIATRIKYRLESIASILK